MMDPPAEVKHFRTLSTRAGDGWIDESTLARWVDADTAEVQLVVAEHKF